jgi:hypothetical protein
MVAACNRSPNPTDRRPSRACRGGSRSSAGRGGQPPGERLRYGNAAPGALSPTRRCLITADPIRHASETRPDTLRPHTSRRDPAPLDELISAATRSRCAGRRGRPAHAAQARRRRHDPSRTCVCPKCWSRSWTCRFTSA